jgi:hypothetical protein
MDPVIVPVLAIVFCLSIPIVAIIVDHFTKKSKMRVMEKAIEKGLSLEGLSLEDERKPRMPYRAGMIVLAVGLGVGIFAVLVGQTDRDDLFPLLGIASIPALIGIALIINDRINFDRYYREKSDPQLRAQSE